MKKIMVEAFWNMVSINTEESDKNRSLAMLLKIMQLYIPEFIKKKKLKELFGLTADAFQSELPELKGLSFAESLSKYALFTKEQAESYLQGGRPQEAVKHRLYQNACALGQNLSKSLHSVDYLPLSCGSAFSGRCSASDSNRP